MVALANALPQARTDRKAAARRQKIVAGGRLRQLALTSALSRGVEVVQVLSGITNWTHDECGRANPHSDPERVITCIGCGKRYDPDVSATHVLLAVRTDAPKPGP